ncbi:glycosyl hydrolase family 28 protein [Mangrovibacterium marinum]|uniref:glycoside hydrolase family 28 protein n=1 Tax=Mangrovibacterium marinum TaxID=1639118 RepID=UPI002A18E3E1|nr:glycosyl hydrolase family 28 protein [Mangrovibacterium marinum]
MSDRLSLLADSLTLNLKPWEVPPGIFRVEDYGAVGDGNTLNTAAIQKAIDACSSAGGGTVLIANGEYVTGTIELKSNVMLEVAENAKILGSTDLKDYPDRIESFESVMSKMHRYRISLVYAEKAINVGICGKGEINFRGEIKHFPGPETIGEIEGRPFGIRMIECSNVVVKDIILTNSGAWMQNYLYCESLIFDGIKVFNHANHNNDGLDPDGCKNVIVRNCFINSHDDALCLKSASGKPCENILIENSVFYSSCNAFKFGTDTQGDFRNIIARNLVLGGIPDSSPSLRGRYECSTGITLETVDGGNVENILIENITIDRSRCPIFMYIGDRGRVLGNVKPDPGYLKNIVIRNVKGKENRRQGSLITGIPEQIIENVVIRDMDITMIGGGTVEMAEQTVPEKVGYPDAQDFNRDGLPAYGFYIRHAKDIYMENIKVTPDAEDGRPEFKSGGNLTNVVVNGTSLE